MLGRVVPLEPVDEPACLGRLERLVQGCWCVRVQIVLNQHDLLGHRGVNVAEFAQDLPIVDGCAPLEGWRHVEVTGRRAGVGYAEILRDLSEVHCPMAEKIVLVQDNLNTHTPASLYETFEPAEARPLINRFEWHYTPKHGSWMNLAESELALLSGQCLKRRIADAATLVREVAAWRTRSNNHNDKADWRFTTANARIKLKSLCPSF